MKILYYFKEKDTFMDKWQRFHFFDELTYNNCHITVVNPLEHATVCNANEYLLSVVDAQSFDLFMTPHNEADLFIDTLSHIKKKGIPTLLICFDNLIIPYFHKKISPFFDLVWLTSKETETMFKKWGAKTVFLPYAANPRAFFPTHASEISSVAFVGTPYGSRANIINSLTSNEIDVSVFSNLLTGEKTALTNSYSGKKIIRYIPPALDLIKFDIGRKIIAGALKQNIISESRLDVENPFLKINPSVNMDDLRNIYSNYGLALASTAARNTGVLKNPVNVVNLRSFEIPMCGGLQFCCYFEELAEYFKDDEEIVFYRSPDEMVEKAKFYLKSENDGLRLKMKTAARKRSEKDHTWLSRFKVVFDYFGLKYL